MTTSVSDCPRTAFCCGARSEGCMTDLRALARWRSEPFVEWFLETVTARQQHVTVSTLPTGRPLCGGVVQQRFLRSMPDKWGHRTNVRCPSWVRPGRTQPEHIWSASPPNSGHEADISDWPLRAGS